MKIKITESQLSKIIDEAGGYDDKNIMNIHAQNVQGRLLHSFAETVEVLNSFLQFTSQENYNKQHILNFVSNFSHKIYEDIQLIESLESEIYIDDDFAETIKKYKDSLKKLNNRLRLLYSGGQGLSFEMTLDELVKEVYNQITEIEDCIEELSNMFGTVHSRFRSRLGLDK